MLDERKAQLMLDARKKLSTDLAEDADAAPMTIEQRRQSLIAGSAKLVMRPLPASAGRLKVPCAPDPLRSRASVFDDTQSDDPEEGRAEELLSETQRVRSDGYTELGELEA